LDCCSGCGVRSVVAVVAVAVAVAAVAVAAAAAAAAAAVVVVVDDNAVASFSRSSTKSCMGCSSADRP